MAYSSVNATLGGKGVKKAHKQAKKYEKAAQRRKQKQALRRMQRKVDQAVATAQSAHVGYTPITDSARTRAADAALEVQAQTRAYQSANERQNIRRIGNVVERGLHPERTKRRIARRKVDNFTAKTPEGTYAKATVPSQENIRLAWETYNKEERARVAKTIIERFNAPGDKGKAGERKHTLPRFLRKYDPRGFDEATRGVKGAYRKGENADDMNASDLARAIEVASFVVPVGRVAEAGYRTYQVARGARGLEGLVRGERAVQAGRGARAAEGAAEGVTNARRVGRVGEAVKATRVGRGAAAAGRGARAAAGTRAGRIALGTGKVATAPIRHPLKSAATYSGVAGAAAVPGAIKSGDLGKIPDAVIGGVGAVPNALHSITEESRDLGFVGNVIADVLELPAAVVPSTYLLGKAAVEAAQGDDTALKEQINAYMDEGLLPAVFKGDADQALKAITEHPVYSALEASGAAAVAGRSAGIAARAIDKDGIGSTTREPLQLGGDLELQRSYSKDLTRKPFQVLADRRRERREGGQIATDRQVVRALNEQGDRVVARNEGVRRRGRGEETDAALAAQPKRKVDQDGVSLAVQNIIRDARSFGSDLDSFIAKVERGAQRLRKIADDSSLPKDRRADAQVKLKINADIVKRLRAVRKNGDPEVIFAAADEHVAALRGLDEELVKAGLLTAEQAEKARLTTPARAHLDTGFGKPKEQVEARAAYKALKKQHKKTQGEVKKAESEIATTREQIAESRGRLNRLEIEARRKANLPKRMATKLKHRHAADRNPRSLVNRERKKLLALEGKLLDQQRSLKGLKKRAESERQALKDKPPKPREQMVDSEGRALSLAELKERLQEVGVDPERVGFITHRPNATGAGSFFRPAWKDRQSLQGDRRTGQSVDEGLFDLDFQNVLEQRVRGRGIVDAVRGFDRMIAEFSLKEDGSPRTFKTYKAAKKAADNPEEFGVDAPRGQTMIPVRTSPFRASKSEAEGARASQEELAAQAADDVTLGDRITDAWADAKRPDGDGPYVLLPRTTVARLDAHFARQPAFQRTMQIINQAFKSTVLPTSKTWIAGNVLDMNMRALFAGNAPMGLGFDRTLTNKVLQRAYEIDPVAAREAEAALVGGTHYSSQAATRIHRSPESFADTWMAPVANALHALREKPAAGKVVDLYTRYRDWVYKANENFLEVPLNKAQLGKAMRREVQETTGKWHHALQLGEGAIDDLAHGLLKTDKQIKYAKSVEEVFGQWTANSPTARAFLVDYAPFGMWTRAAAKYVYLTLPAKHPIKTAIMASIEQMTQEERESLGLSFFAEDPVPAQNMGAVPLPGGGIAPTGSLTSFGFFNDIQANVVKSILPQFSNSIDAAKGYDWKGDKLAHEDGTPLTPAERPIAALVATAETYTPFLSLSQRMSEEDGPGPLRTALDPFSNTVDAGIVEWLRSLNKSRSIDIPVGGGSSSSSGGSSYSVPNLSGGFGSSYSGAGSSSGGFGSSYRP